MIALALASVVVVMPMGVLLMPLPWIAWVVIASKREAKRGRGLSTLAAYSSVTALVVVAAHLAPVKTSERILDGRVVLPKTKLTLAELDRDNNFENAGWMPPFISVDSSPATADHQIRFRATDITLREFVKTIEEQSELRHRFRHCGNGATVLYGGDCRFGLWLR